MQVVTPDSSQVEKGQRFDAVAAAKPDNEILLEFCVENVKC